MSITIKTIFIALTFISAISTHGDHLHEEVLKEVIEMDHDHGDIVEDHLDHHECVHDKLEESHLWEDFHNTYDPELETSYMEQMEAFRSTSLRNRYLKANWKGIRIQFIYQLSKWPHQAVNFIKRDLVNPVGPLFGKMLNIKRNPNGVQMNSNKCYKASTPGGTHFSNADLVVYVTMTNEPKEGFLAWATSCNKDAGSLRPNVGQINFNYHHLKTSAAYVKGDWKTALENQISTVMHELTHVLAFSSQLYKYYQNHKLQTVGKAHVQMKRHDGTFAIHSPNVQYLGRHYFKCAALQGVGLENGGGSGTAGSHWERSELGDEAMTGADINEPRYSMFTMALLQDSGWYNVNFKMADTITWGLKEGCKFISQKCKARKHYMEFCYKKMDNSCNEDGDMSTYCTGDQYSDGCMYWHDYSNGIVHDRTQKRCFVFEVNGQKTTRQEKFTCHGTSSISVQFQGQGSFLCHSRKVVSVPGYTVPIKIHCPRSVKAYCSNVKKRMARKIADSE